MGDLPPPWDYLGHQARDRLGRMADAAASALEAHPEAQPGDQVIILVNDGHKGGMAFGGYPSPHAAAIDLLVYLRALFRMEGKEIRILTARQTGRDS